MHGRLNTGIDYAPSMEEYLACTEAGLDYERWAGFKDPPYNEILKAQAVVGYRYKNLIRAHTEAAQNKAAERKSRKK